MTPLRARVRFCAFPDGAMRVGLTYDLREDYLAMGYGEEETAEFDRPDTIASIEGALQALGHETDRVGHVRALVTRLAAGDRWDLVFNIAEGLSGFGRESQVPALLEAYGIPFTFSDALVMALSLHKGMCKRVVRDLGLPTPAFAVIEDLGDLDGLDLPYPLFAKPVVEGTGKGVDTRSRADDPAALRAACAHLLHTFGQPVLVETFLPGREFTVGIVGTGDDAVVVGAMEIVLKREADAGIYSYETKEHSEELVEYPLADPSDPLVAASYAIALAAWRGLGCRDGGRVDVRADAHGGPNFFEVNPLAGMHPAHSDLPILATLTGMPYVELIRRIVDSARARVRS